ncbi:PAS domain-containing response regulator [Halorientalis litorea]|jgi:PAS domain S-box-containing protein|uniref:PAS domain-containing response regulator n=1 Tax=Halorientalis litorea TaxID=2931977 RepID=UPI001FF3B5A3|nr:PAS domain S-box protein [Halorientalis litorea]
MEDAGGTPHRVGFVGADSDVAEWVRAGFERATEPVDFVIEESVSDAVEHVETAQHTPDPRLRTPMGESDPPFDGFVVTDDGDWDPTDVTRRIRNRDGTLPVVLFLDDGSEDIAGRAVAADASGYVTRACEEPTGTLVARVLDCAATARRERATRKERALSARLVEKNPEVVTVVRPGADLAFGNGRVDEVLGFDPAEVDGRLPYERIHEDDWQDLREEFYDAVIDPDYIPTVEFRVRDDDGGWRAVEARGRNLLSDPVVRGFVVIIRDVSERREREREHELYRQVVENVGNAMYVLDPEGYFEWVNDAFVRQTGYEREFVEGTHVSAFIGEDDYRTATELVSELREEGANDWRRFGFVAENVEGDIRRVVARVSILSGADDEFRGIVGVLRDVTGES